MSDFIVSMNKAQFSARNGFKIWQDAVPVKLHPSLTKFMNKAQFSARNGFKIWQDARPCQAPSVPNE
ncbi:hypothetical protein THAOC_20192, partial [Thalassiosira oceanica]